MAKSKTLKQQMAEEDAKIEAQIGEFAAVCVLVEEHMGPGVAKRVFDKLLGGAMGGEGKVIVTPPQHMQWNVDWVSHVHKGVQDGTHTHGIQDGGPTHSVHLPQFEEILAASKSSGFFKATKLPVVTSHFVLNGQEYINGEQVLNWQWLKEECPGALWAMLNALYLELGFPLKHTDTGDESNIVPWIKRVRDVFGLGLKTAKLFVEWLRYQPLCLKDDIEPLDYVVQDSWTKHTSINESGVVVELQPMPWTIFKHLYPKFGWPDIDMIQAAYGPPVDHVNKVKWIKQIRTMGDSYGYGVGLVEAKALVDWLALNPGVISKVPGGESLKHQGTFTAKLEAKDLSFETLPKDQKLSEAHKKLNDLVTNTASAPIPYTDEGIKKFSEAVAKAAGLPPHLLGIGGKQEFLLSPGQTVKKGDTFIMQGQHFYVVEDETGVPGQVKAVALSDSPVVVPATDILSSLVPKTADLTWIDELGGVKKGAPSYMFSGQQLGKSMISAHLLDAYLKKNPDKKVLLVDTEHHPEPTFGVPQEYTILKKQIEVKPGESYSFSIDKDKVTFDENGKVLKTTEDGTVEIKPGVPMDELLKEVEPKKAGDKDGK